MNSATSLRMSSMARERRTDPGRQAPRSREAPPLPIASPWQSMRPPARARSSAARIAAVPARYALAGIVALSFVFRLAAVLAHSVPLYFPDEYIYGTLARSLAESGKLAIRGQPAHFPALLEPLLAAPFWLFHDPMLAYRLTLGLNALAMSLAAIPVYLLARRLGLGAGLALGAAALAVASPDLLFASFLLADPIAYPLVLTALYLGVRALEHADVEGAGRLRDGRAGSRPSHGSSTRCCRSPSSRRRSSSSAGASAATGRRSRCSGFPCVAVVALGPSRVLGYYSVVGHDHVPAFAALKWAAIDTMMLAYSAGWILIPGAIVGLALALARPHTRVERAFGALALFVSAGVFVEAAIYAARGSTRYQERYLFALLPLVALAFGLYVRRGWPHRLAVALVSGGDAPPLGARAALRLHRRRQQAGLAVPVRRLPPRGAALGRGPGRSWSRSRQGSSRCSPSCWWAESTPPRSRSASPAIACVLASVGSFVFDRDNAVERPRVDAPRPHLDRPHRPPERLARPDARRAARPRDRAALLEPEREPGRPAPGRRGDRRVRRHAGHRYGRRANGRRPRADHRPDPVRVVRGAGGADGRALRRPRREPRPLQARRDASPLAPRRRALHRRLARPCRAAHRLARRERPHGRNADPPALSPEGHPADPDDLHRAWARSGRCSSRRAAHAPSSSTRAAGTRGCSTTAPPSTPISTTDARSASSSTRRSSSGTRRSP